MAKYGFLDSLLETNIKKGLSSLLLNWKNTELFYCTPDLNLHKTEAIVKSDTLAVWEVWRNAGSFSNHMPISLSHHVLRLWKLALPILHLKPDQLFNNIPLWSAGKEKIYYRFPPGLGGKSPDSDAEWRGSVLCHSRQNQNGGWCERARQQSPRLRHSAICTRWIFNCRLNCSRPVIKKRER